MGQELVYYRNTLSVFRAGFYADAAHINPIIPVNSDYPKYSIYNPDGVEILSGVGSSGVGSGEWQAQLVLDQDLPLTTPSTRYKISWTMVNANSQQFESTTEFEVLDAVVSEPESREQKYVALAGSTTRIKLTLPYQPSELAFKVFQGNDQQTPIFEVSAADLTKVPNGNQYTYYADLPGNLLFINAKYAVIWRIRETETDTEQFAFQSLTAVGSATLNAITSMRMLIDKFQKRLGSIQAYEDSDIVEYLERGAELLNGTFPISSWAIGYVPPQLNVFHIILSAWYALNAQQLLEIDLGFDFSGQSVTLNYDHASALADVMSRWQDYIEKNLSAAKMSILNSTGSVGTSAGRGFRLTQSMTWRVASLGTSGNMNSNSVMGQMNTLGLLW